MKSIMSISHKFMEVTPRDLVETISDYNVDGFEISCNDIKKIKYLHDLAYECKLHNKKFQIHGDSSLSIDLQIKFLKEIEEISDLLGYKIIVVLHSIYDEDKNISIYKTTEYMNKLTKLIDNEKLIITLENLNDDYGIDRLDKDEIMPIICNNENLYFTYDIGHEISDCGNICTTNEILIPLIKNIHIHTNTNYKNYCLSDHQPIYKSDKFWNSIIKTITFLKINKYDGPIVFEYDLYALDGDNIKEKIINYAKSMEFIFERFK